MFTGFPEETTQFLLDLRFHNSIAWFNENKERYLRDVQTPFYAFIEDALPTLREIDPQVEVRPYKLLSRIRRDTRFSRDKSPYRDHHWIWFKRGGEDRWQSLGFWFEFGPGKLSWGMATWDENRPLMDRFRRELAADPRRYGSIIRSCGLAERHLQMDGTYFRRIDIPAGISAELEPWYRLRSMAIIQTHPDLRETASREILGHVLADFKAMTPIYQLLRGMQDALENEADAEAEKPVVRNDEW